MFKHYKIQTRKKIKAVKKEKACYYYVLKNSKVNFIRKSFYYNSKLPFFTRLVNNIFKLSSCSRKRLSVCSVSGKYRSQIHEMSLKRHTANKIMLLNMLPNIIKKTKNCY